MQFVKLKELCEFEKGSTGLAKAEPGDYPLVTTGTDRKSCNTYQFDTKAVCIPLVSSTGHGHASLNNVHYQEGKFALGSILVALTSKDGDRLDIQFLHLYLSQLKDQVLVPLMSGAANVSLTVKKVQSIELPLPPIDRQREIVDKFKSIVVEEDQLIAELNYQKKLLKQLRPQILQEAIEGNLTADWRMSNPDVEPAIKLLKRIDTTQKEWIKNNIENGYKEASVINKKLNNIKIFPAKSSLLPESWVFCPLISAVNLIVDCHNKTATYESSGIKLVRTTNIRDRKLDLVTTKYVSEATYEFWSKRAKLKKGDILFTREAPVGEAAMIPADEKICMGQRMMCIRTFENLVDNQYLLYAITEPSFLKRLEGNQKGAMVKHLRVGDVENALIALPPLDEQKIIVSKIGKLFSLCDQLESQTSHNQTHAQLLMQAVLTEAFSNASGH